MTKSRIRGIALAVVFAGVGACKGDDPTGPGARLYIVRQPTQGVAGVPLSPALEVRLEDSSGRPTEGSITVEIDRNACGFPLGGVTTVQASDGSATFGSLTLETVARGYRLSVRSGTLQANASTFDVTPPFAPGGALVQTHTLCTKPNPQGDAESLEYVPEDDVFWSADDDAPSIFAVDRLTGAFRTRLTVAQFLAAFPSAGTCDDGDGDPNTSCSYVNELEHLAYDRLDGSMYVMNTVNSLDVTPVKDRPAMFRVRRGAGCSACWTFDTWKPLPAAYESLMSIDGTLYVSIGRNVYQYDFDANQDLTTDEQGNPLPPSYRAESGVDRLKYDGTHVWIILRTGVLKQIDWQSRTAVASFDLPARGVATPSGVERVDGSLYILDGDPPNPILLFEAPSGL